MFIRKIMVGNYKCFNLPTVVSFTQGINLLVGENNSGKSTLLNLLRLQELSPNPHNTVYRQFIEGHWAVWCEIGLPYSEFSKLFRKEQPVKISFNTYKRELNRLTIDEYFQSFMVDNELVYVWFDLQHKHAFFSDIDQFLFEPKQVFNAEIWIDLETKTTKIYSVSGQGSNLYNSLIPLINRKIFTLSSERRNVARYQVENSTRGLVSNGENLASVLNTIANQDIPTFRKIINNVREVFPEVTHISTPVEDRTFLITVWYSDPSDIENQISYPLDECGSGLNQIILLFTALNLSKEQKVFLIDEPQSYLHPRSIRILFDILQRDYSENQYIVATHSPFVIKASEPCPINFIRKNSNSETEIQSLDLNRDTDIQDCMEGLGIKFSDIFGIDKIIWVEGESDKRIFSFLAESNNLYSLDVRFVPVINTGDFSGKNHKLRQNVISLYEEWSKATFNPNMSILFDGDQRKVLLSRLESMDLDVIKSSRIIFLNRFMVENYLLNPTVITKYLIKVNNADGVSDKDIREKVDEVFENTEEFIGVKENEYLVDNNFQEEDWKSYIHGKKFINKIFLKVLGRDYEEILDGSGLCELLIVEGDEDILKLVEELRIFS